MVTLLIQNVIWFASKMTCRLSFYCIVGQYSTFLHHMYGIAFLSLISFPEHARSRVSGGHSSGQPRSQGLRGETVTKTLVKFILSFQKFGKKIACDTLHAYHQH